MEDLFGILVFCIACILPVAAIAIPIYYVNNRNKQRNEGAAAVGQALGLHPTIHFKKMQWQEGTLRDGRKMALIPIVISRRSYSTLAERTRTIYDSAVRICIEILSNDPLGIRVVRHIKWTEERRPFDSFETAFKSEFGSNLSWSAQDALLEFAKTHPGTLWLEDRRKAPSEIFNSPEILSGVGSFLLYEFYSKNPEVEEIKAHTAALVKLAQIIENG